MTEQILSAGARNRFLDRVERLGNALPDPVFIFLIIIAIVIAMFAIYRGWLKSAAVGHPMAAEVLRWLGGADTVDRWVEGA